MFIDLEKYPQNQIKHVNRQSSTLLIYNKVGVWYGKILTLTILQRKNHVK